MYGNKMMTHNISGITGHVSFKNCKSVTASFVVLESIISNVFGTHAYLWSREIGLDGIGLFLKKSFTFLT